MRTFQTQQLRMTELQTNMDVWTCGYSQASIQLLHHGIINEGHTVQTFQTLMQLLCDGITIVTVNEGLQLIL